MRESSMRAHAGLRTRLGQPWGARTSFLVVAAVQATLFAGSNLPTPLFPLYERRYDFGSGVVTLLFVSYVAVLIPSMLTLGRLSDALGRRPVMIAGLALTGLSSLAFAGARNVGWLFAGEVAYGVAAGMVNSGVVAALRELHPEDSAAGGALGVTAAQVTGLLIGPLASGVLAATTPWPLVSPYALDIALVLALLVALAKVPETRPQVVRSRPPMFVVPHEIRAQFVPAVLVAAVGWMTAGWVFALSPLFLREQLDVGRPAVAGAFAAVVLATNLATQVAFWRGRTERVQRLGLPPPSPHNRAPPLAPPLSCSSQLDRVAVVVRDRQLDHRAAHRREAEHGVDLLGPRSAVGRWSDGDIARRQPDRAGGLVVVGAGEDAVDV